MQGAAMNHVFMVLCVALLAGCARPSELLSLDDGRILFDSKGCAFIIRHDTGSRFYIYRVQDADKGECQR